MSANDTPFPFPANFEDRSRKTYARLAGGEAMTNEQIAAALGLPLEFFAATLAVYAALIARRPVLVGPVVEPSENRKLH